MIAFLQTTMLFILTAIAEIIGCYLPWLILKQGRSVCTTQKFASTGATISAIAKTLHRATGECGILNELVAAAHGEACVCHHPSSSAVSKLGVTEK